MRRAGDHGFGARAGQPTMDLGRALGRVSFSLWGPPGPSHCGVSQGGPRQGALYGAPVARATVGSARAAQGRVSFMGPPWPEPLWRSCAAEDAIGHS